MKFKKFIITFLVGILSLFSIVMLLSNIKTYNDRNKTSISERNFMSEISHNLEALFNEYNDNLTNNFLVYQQKHKNLNFNRNNIIINNIENEILKFIFYINGEIFVDFEGLKIFNLQEGMINIFLTDEFNNSIKQSISENIFIVNNKNIIHNENFMLTEESQNIPMSRSRHRDF